MFDLSAVTPTVSTAPDVDIAPPVLASNTRTTKPDFVDQHEIDAQWWLLQDGLRTITLSEQEALAVLSSGILQTNTGKALAGLFADAILRSIRPLGSLSSARLKEIIDALCHLPPGQWQAALGENIRFSGEPNSQSVKGFIQAQLDRSSVLRDERVAGGELLSDSHWETLKTLTKTGRQYIRSGDGKVLSALEKLEEESEIRPSSKDVYAKLETFIRHLEKKDVKRPRWTDRYVTQAKALRDELKPLEIVKPTWLEWVIGPSWMETLFDGADRFSAMMISSQSSMDLTSFDEQSELLSLLQKFERSTDFYSNVNTAGPRYPESLAGKLLYMFNAMDTFGVLRMDSSHISTARPLSTPTGANTEQNAPVVPALPIDLPIKTPETAPSAIPSLVTLEQYAEQIDEVVTRFMNRVMPWDSVNGAEPFEIIDMESLLDRDVYRETTEPTDPEGLSARMGDWLSKMADHLLGAGVAVADRTGDLVKQNPGKAIGLFAAYMAISNLYAAWFQPEPEQMVDPLQGIVFPPTEVPDETTVVVENIVEGLEDIFDIFPELSIETQRLISESDYEDPADDPQLFEKLEALLRLPVPGRQDVTYQDYFDEIITLAVSDAHDEFEEREVSGVTTDPVLTTQVQPEIMKPDEHVIRARSVDDNLDLLSKVEFSPFGGAHGSADWLLLAAQRSLDADNGIGPGETIAPGYTIDQAVDQISNDCHVLQNILEPPSYLLSAIDDFIARSDLSEPFKRYLTYKTPFTVHYDLHNLFGEVIGETRKKDFTLLELVMGLHKREQELHEKIRLDWSSGYTPGFRGAIDGASIWEEYKVAHNKFISEPRYFDLWKLKIELEIKLLVEDFAGGEQASELGRRIAREYLNGNIRVQPLSIQKGKFSNPIEVSNAVFLSSGTGGEGLFVFLGANGKVIESPVEIFKEGGKSIEMFPELREALLKRIPLQELLAFGDTDFKYSQGRFVWSLNNIEMFKNYKWSYKPILFGLQPGHNYCEGTNDIFKCMFDTVVDKAKSDMDAMTFTATERAIDIALDMLAETLKYSGYGVALTGAAAAAFLLGASSSVTQYLRGLISDNPSEASRHKSNAVVGMIGQVVGKYIGQLLGKAISRAAQTRIAQRIIERLRPTGPTPGTAIYQASKNVHATSPVANQVNKIERWIAPRVRDLVNIQDKVNRKFTNSLVVERLKSLGKGPHVAQRLMNRSRVLYFAGSRQGYVYRGFAMRGDMRRPEDVFIKGFDSNSGQASGYYNSNGMGAFHHGGKQGGWTYLIDARGLDGEDLLRNINWKAGAGSQLGSNPYRIAYTDKIPGSNVVGAYDSTGKFFPNPNALKSALEKSIPKPIVEDVPFPIKGLLQNKNSTHTPIKLPQ